MNPVNFDKVGPSAPTSPCNSAIHSQLREPRNQPHTAVTGLNYSAARHKEYIDRSNRLFSFTTWRYPDVQDPTKLANLGFFYTGESDLVRCFNCSLGLKDFIASDDPLKEHVRYSGNCEFLVQLLGPGRLREIKNNIRAETDVFQRGSAFNQEDKSAVSQEKTENDRTQNPRPQQSAQRYRHPEYSSHAVRFSSFKGWPTHLVQTPQVLAEAGFYYTGVRDIVRCFACDGGLQVWEPTDDPWIEHCINFPTCVYLKQTKGDDYIASAITRHRQPKALVNDSRQSQNVNTKSNDHTVSGEGNKPTTSNIDSVVNTLVTMGFKQTDIDLAIKTLNSKGHQISIEKVIDEIQGNSDEAKETPTTNPKELLEERERLRRQLYCIRCKTQEINSLFLPCQHHRFCTACSENMTVCPCCGGRIAHKIKTYRP